MHMNGSGPRSSRATRRRACSKLHGPHRRKRAVTDAQCVGTSCQVFNINGSKRTCDAPAGNRVAHGVIDAKGSATDVGSGRNGKHRFHRIRVNERWSRSLRTGWASVPLGPTVDACKMPRARCGRTPRVTIGSARNERRDGRHLLVPQCLHRVSNCRPVRLHAHGEHRNEEREQ